MQQIRDKQGSETGSVAGNAARGLEDCMAGAGECCSHADAEGEGRDRRKVRSGRGLSRSAARGTRHRTNSAIN